MNIKYLIISILSLCFIFGFGLYYKISTIKKDGHKKKPLVVCTTTILGNTIQEIVKESIDIQVLMKPGVDPHTYKAIEPDLLKIAQADAIMYHGLHLEARMADLFAHLSHQKKTYAVSDCIDPKKLICADQECNIYDPHIWLHPELWLEVVKNITKIVCLIRPDEKDTYLHNSYVLSQRILQAHESNKTRFKKIPKSKRILITSHDAFSYFAKCYDFEVLSLQGINTASETGIADVEKITNFIVDHKVPTVFIESSIPPKTMQAIQERVEKKMHHVEIGDELYSDSLSGPNEEASTYIDMINHNTDVIIKGLSKNN